MVLFTPFGIEGNGAADRVDALVWALTDLFPRMTRKAGGRRLGRHVRQEAHGGGGWLA